MTEPSPDYTPDPAQSAQLPPAFLLVLSALLKAERVLAALPPAYCRPTVLLEVQDAIVAALGPKP